MRWRILGTGLATVAFLASLPGFLAGGSLALRAAGLWSPPTFAILVGASIFASVVVFRAVHDWVVLRWSNETDPFVYGEWRPGRWLTMRSW